MDSTTPQFAELVAPTNWQVVDFISDLHLQSSEPATLEAWQLYMAHTRADAVFILGDLFEVWIGDDCLLAKDSESQFEQRCADILRTCSAHKSVYFIHGNRDFLLGNAFASATGVQLLNDPSVLTFGAQRWLLSHADAMCLEDRDYLKFRAQVRHPDWCRLFLAKPLDERRALARGLRQLSEERKQSGVTYADVDHDLARHWLTMSRAHHLIHGHTHRPADHPLGNEHVRYVLSDWDAEALPPRSEVFRLTRVSQTGFVGVQRLSATTAS